jgi:hypothetical protein
MDPDPDPTPDPTPFFSDFRDAKKKFFPIFFFFKLIRRHWIQLYQEQNEKPRVLADQNPKPFNGSGSVINVGDPDPHIFGPPGP